jgi:hypothetical protein
VAAFCRALFQIADALSADRGASWELHLAGDAMDETSKQLLEGLQRTYATRACGGAFSGKSG